MLAHILKQDDYALALAPGFFRFYAHIGVLHGLEELGCLNVSHVSGCSAGALVAAFLAAGMKPSEMAAAVMPITREDVWDVGGIGGLLKGDQFLNLIEKHLPRKTFEDAIIPCSVTAFDMVRLKTKNIISGSLAVAARASCTFPGLFQPVMIDGTPHIDGGVWDGYGLMALEESFRLGEARNGKTSSADGEFKAPSNKLVVNVVYDRAGASKLPESFSNCRLLTIIMENIPMVSPFSMHTMGPLAYNLSKTATIRALYSSHIQEVSPNHWHCFVDGNLVLDFVKAQLEQKQNNPIHTSISEKFTSSTMPPPAHTMDRNRSISLSSLQSGNSESSERSTSVSSVTTEPLVEGVSKVISLSDIVDDDNNTSATRDSESSTSSEATEVVTVVEAPKETPKEGKEVTSNEEPTTTTTTTTNTNTTSSKSNKNTNNIQNTLSVLTHIPFHLPNLPLPIVPDLTTSMRDMIAIPSYSFINGTYYMLSHGWQESSMMLMKSMNDTMQHFGATTTSSTTMSSSSPLKRSMTSNEDINSNEVAETDNESTFKRRKIDKGDKEDEVVDDSGVTLSSAPIKIRHK